jgi:TolB-like protein
MTALDARRGARKARAMSHRIASWARFFAIFALLALSARARAAPPRLAVMDFTDAAPQGTLEHLGKGLQSMITTDLTAASAFSLVERARLRDVQAELKLQRRAEIDAKTAVQVGKLAGASHLVSGSFTVLDDKMRIDCRVVAVDSGKVMLAEKVEGDKSAFFELEKTLVQKVVAALGTKVEPKQRAQMAKVHTADFEAFKLFSQGVAEFDAQKYDAALKALRGATQLDPEFKLAEITLTGYEEIVTKARANLAAVKQTEAEIKQLEGDRDSQTAAAIIKKLAALTKQGPVLSRGVALSLLWQVHAQGGTRDGGPLNVMHERADQFAHKRASEAYLKAYWLLASESFPTLPLRADFLDPPQSLESFDKVFAAAQATAKERARDELKEWRVDSAHYQALALQLDRRQEAELAERIYRLALKQKPELEWQVARQVELGTAFQNVGDFDRSTAYLLAAQKGTKSSSVLSKITELLEANRECAQALASTQLKSELREAVTFFFPTSCKSDRIERFQKPALGSDAAGRLFDFRRWPRYPEEFVWIDNEPYWGLSGNLSLLTGPRSDKRRARDLRYWSNDEDHALVVAGIAPAQDFKATFLVDHAVPEDLRLAKPEVASDPRAPVSLVFGLRSLKQKGQPAEGYAVRIAHDAIRLVQLRSERPEQLAWKETPIAQTALSRRAAPQLKVEVRCSGNSLTVNVGGQSWTTQLAKPVHGFVGFGFDGAGYAAVRDVELARE